jgi:hypothetical protein
VAKVSKGGELYLAATHFHPEHDLGAGGFPPATKMLRSRDQQADIDEFGLQTVKRFAGFSPLPEQSGRRTTKRRSGPPEGGPHEKAAPTRRHPYVRRVRLQADHHRCAPRSIPDMMW